MVTMRRREFLQVTGMSWAALAGTGLAAEPGRKRPNLLVIHTDEHNFRTLGCYRKTLPPEQAFMWGKDAVVETPNIDWIARSGAICTSFYATTPVCSPSRASFVSGRYPQNTPVVKNGIPLNDDIITFAEILRRNGYATGYAGKWHLDGGGKPQWAPERTFGFDDNRYMFNRGHWKKLTDTPGGPKVDTGAKPSYDVSGATAENFTTDWLADKTLTFITRNRHKPFCYMVSIPDPHGPDSVRAPYNEQYTGMTFARPRTAGKKPGASPSWASPGRGKTKMSQYFGMVKCIDDNVGRILDHLRENKLLDNTIIVFTADHGDLCGEHGRHNKGVPLEASARIPFVIHYPDKIKAGTTVAEALGTVDFLPTILGLMGVETAGREEGRDASALFLSHKTPGEWNDITFVRGTGPQPNWLAAITGRYKLVLSPRDPPWLIDLQKDPDELKNVCADPAYAEIVRTLAEELLAYGKRFNDKRVSEETIAGGLAELIAGN